MISASRTGASSSARITFLSRDKFKLTGWTLSDTARDSRAVMVCVGMVGRYGSNGGEEPCGTNSAGYGSIAGFKDWTSGFPYLRTVAFQVCTYNSWRGPDCTWGTPVVNPYGA